MLTFEVIGDIHEGGATGAEEGVFGLEVTTGGEGLDKRGGTRLLHVAQHGQAGGGEGLLGRGQLVGQLQVIVLFRGP